MQESDHDIYMKWGLQNFYKICKIQHGKKTNVSYNLVVKLTSSLI